MPEEECGWKCCKEYVRRAPLPARTVQLEACRLSTGLGLQASHHHMQSPVTRLTTTCRHPLLTGRESLQVSPRTKLAKPSKPLFFEMSNMMFDHGVRAGAERASLTFLAGTGARAAVFGAAPSSREGPSTVVRSRRSFPLRGNHVSAKYPRGGSVALLRCSASSSPAEVQAGLYIVTNSAEGMRLQAAAAIVAGGAAGTGTAVLLF